MSVVIVGGLTEWFSQYMDTVKNSTVKESIYTATRQFQGTDWSGGFDYPFHQHCFPHHGKRRSTGGRKKQYYH